MVTRLAVVVVVVGLAAGGASADTTLFFTSNTLCLDASQQNASGASASCQACMAHYDADGRIMADAVVNVHDSPGGDGSLIGCATDTGAITGVAGAGGLVRVDGPAGASIPLQITWNVSVSHSNPQCSGSAVVNAENQQFEIDHGGRSGVFNLNVAAGAPAAIGASATVTCSGCQFFDDDNGRHFIHCDNEGQVIADPVPSVDPRWPLASLYTISVSDPVTGDFVPLPPPDLDQDDDGFEQPADCNDFDPAIHPGQTDIPDNGIDEDCTGEDAHATGLDDGDTCSTDAQCTSGTCVCTGPDCSARICCESRCGDGAADDCQSCIQAETGEPDGVCAPLAANTICRPADDACDLAEVCDGVRHDCPGDFRKLVGETCRPAAGTCDVEETCVATGSTTHDYKTICPPDIQLPSDGQGDACTTGMAGACAAGIMTCGTCVPTGAAPERCNGVDDDCDGIADNGFPTLGEVCFAGVGACSAAGQVECDAGGGVRCNAVPFDPQPETCNQQDDDCDGQLDEDFPELGTTCQVGQGTCRATGVVACSVFGDAACAAEPGAPTAEICNGLDDDCNGVVDDGACGFSAAPDAYATAMDTPLVVSALDGVLANDQTGGLGVLGVIAVLDGGPAGGTLGFAADGAFVYTPNPCTQGSDTFSYHLLDLVSLIAGPSVTVSIDIASRPATFAFAAGELALGEGETGDLMVRRSGECSTAVTVTCRRQAGTAGAADFQTGTTVLAFAPGDLVHACSASTLADTLVEGSEAFYLRLEHPTGGSALGRQRLAVVTVIDDDDAGTIELADLATEVDESAGQLALTVRRTGATPGTTATVKWAAAAASATTADFALLAGETKTVTFGPDETEKTIALAITPDILVEGTEHLRVSLSSPSAGSRLGANKSEIVHIRDDDAGGVVELAQLTTEVSESAGRVELAIRRSGAGAGATTTVHWAATAITATTTDFALLPGETGTVTFAPGEISKAIAIAITPDDLAEGTELFRVKLSAPSAGSRLGPARTAVVAIRDDDLPPATSSFELATLSTEVSESAGSVTVQVGRTGDTATTATVRWTVGAGTAGAADVTLATGVLAFAPGEVSQPVVIALTPDVLVEGHEDVRVTLSRPTGGTVLGDVRSAVVHILDDDDGGAIELGAATVTASEGATFVDVPVVRTGATGGVAATVTWKATAGTATAADFALLPGETGTLVFGPDETTTTLRLAIIDDAIVEGVESLRITLSDPSTGARLGADRSGAIVIADDDLAPAYAVPAVTRVSEHSATCTVTISRDESATAGSVSIKTIAASAGAADFTPLAVTVVPFAAGQTTATVEVPLLDDTLVEGDEAFAVVLSSPVGGVLAPAQRGVVVIEDDD